MGNDSCDPILPIECAPPIIYNSILPGVGEWGLDERFFKRALEASKPWEKYDLMKEYRSMVPLEDQYIVWKEVDEHRETVEEEQKRQRRRKLLDTAQ